MTMIKINLSGHQNDSLEEKGFLFPGIIHADMNVPFEEIFLKVVKLLQELGIKSDSTVEIAVPGMSSLAVMVITAIHGLTGQFPIIAPLVRSNDGTFINVETVDLQVLRNDVSRTNRENVITL